MSEPKGLKEILAALSMFPKKIHKNVLVGATRATAYTYIKKARELTPTKTGLLKKSGKIKKHRSKNANIISFSVSFGNEIKFQGKNEKPHYAHMIEFGTSKMSANPFLRPAFEAVGPNAIISFRKYAEKRISKEIEKAKKC